MWTNWSNRLKKLQQLQQQIQNASLANQQQDQLSTASGGLTLSLQHSAGGGSNILSPQLVLAPQTYSSSLQNHNNSAGTIQQVLQHHVRQSSILQSTIQQHTSSQQQCFTDLGGATLNGGVSVQPGSPFSSSSDLPQQTIVAPQPLFQQVIGANGTMLQLYQPTTTTRIASANMYKSKQPQILPKPVQHVGRISNNKLSHQNSNNSILLNQMVSSGMLFGQQQSGGVQLLLKPNVANSAPKTQLILANGSLTGSAQSLVVQQANTQPQPQIFRVVSGQSLQLQQIQTSAGPAYIAIPTNYNQAVPLTSLINESNVVKKTSNQYNATINISSNIVETSSTSPVNRHRGKQVGDERRLDLANLIKLSGIDEEDALPSSTTNTSVPVPCSSSSSISSLSSFSSSSPPSIQQQHRSSPIAHNYTKHKLEEGDQRIPQSPTKEHNSAATAALLSQLQGTSQLQGGLRLSLSEDGQLILSQPTQQSHISSHNLSTNVATRSQLAQLVSDNNGQILQTATLSLSGSESVVLKSHGLAVQQSPSVMVQRSSNVIIPESQTPNGLGVLGVLSGSNQDQNRVHLVGGLQTTDQKQQQQQRVQIVTDLAGVQLSNEQRNQRIQIIPNSRTVSITEQLDLITNMPSATSVREQQGQLFYDSAGHIQSDRSSSVHISSSERTNIHITNIPENSGNTIPNQQTKFKINVGGSLPPNCSIALNERTNQLEIVQDSSDLGNHRINRDGNSKIHIIPQVDARVGTDSEGRVRLMSGDEQNRLLVASVEQRVLNSDVSYGNSENRVHLVTTGQTVHQQQRIVQVNEEESRIEIVASLPAQKPQNVAQKMFQDQNGRIFICNAAASNEQNQAQNILLNGAGESSNLCRINITRNSTDEIINNDFKIIEQERADDNIGSCVRVVVENGASEVKDITTQFRSDSTNPRAITAEERAFMIARLNEQVTPFLTLTDQNTSLRINENKYASTRDDTRSPQNNFSIKQPASPNKKIANNKHSQSDTQEDKNVCNVINKNDVFLNGSPVKQLEYSNNHFENACSPGRDTNFPKSMSSGGRNRKPKKSAVVKPMVFQGSEHLRHDTPSCLAPLSTGSAASSGLGQKVQTIQLTPQKQQQLKVVQDRIAELSGQKVRTASEQSQLQQLFNEQQTILMSGKIVPTIPGLNTEGLSFVSTPVRLVPPPSIASPLAPTSTSPSCHKSLSPLHCQVGTQTSPGENTESSNRADCESPDLKKCLSAETATIKKECLPSPIVKLPSKTTPEKIALIQTQLKIDQSGAVHPDYQTPFTSRMDSVKRLLRYHTLDQPVLTARDLEIADEIFESTAQVLLDRKRQLLNRFQFAMLKESTREVRSSELIMVNRLFVANERIHLETSRQEFLTHQALKDKLQGTSEQCANSESVKVEGEIGESASVDADPKRQAHHDTKRHAGSHHDGKRHHSSKTKRHHLEDEEKCSVTDAKRHASRHHPDDGRRQYSDEGERSVTTEPKRHHSGGKRLHTEEWSDEMEESKSHHLDTKYHNDAEERSNEVEELKWHRLDSKRHHTDAEERSNEVEELKWHRFDTKRHHTDVEEWSDRMEEPKRHYPDNRRHHNDVEERCVGTADVKRQHSDAKRNFPDVEERSGLAVEAKGHLLGSKRPPSDAEERSNVMVDAKRLHFDTKRHLPDADEEINAQVQNAIDSILNLQRSDSITEEAVRSITNL